MAVPGSVGRCSTVICVRYRWCSCVVCVPPGLAAAAGSQVAFRAPGGLLDAFVVAVGAVRCCALVASIPGVREWSHPFVLQRDSSWACIGNPKPEQETIKGTHAQGTSAYQRRPTSQRAAQGSKPPIRALYMQLAKIPHTSNHTREWSHAFALVALRAV